jgi:ketopantoate hydroxymethyltransferase
VTEIAHLGRDKVTGLEFRYRMQGKDAENAERIKREALELQEAGASRNVL